MAKSFKYSAIMVEPRQHSAYELVLRNFLENLSSEWQFHLFVGHENEEYVRSIVNRMSDEKSKENRVCIHNIGISNLSAREYCKLFIDPSFLYHFIQTETFLVFQTDCLINPNDKHLINEFLYLDYDYVGAPWVHSQQVGNGGLSLRKKTKMLEIINNKIWDGEEFEDYFFSFYPGIHKPLASHAKFFSVETLFTEHSFGLHKCWNYVDANELAYLKKKNPLLGKLIELQ
jgi:hypothetical protein